MTDQTTPMKQEEWKAALRDIKVPTRENNDTKLFMIRLEDFISQLLLQKEQEVREGIKEKIGKLTIYYTIKDENIDLMGNQPVYRTEDVEDVLK